MPWIDLCNIGGMAILLRTLALFAFLGIFASSPAQADSGIPGGSLVQHVAGASADTTGNRQEAKWQVSANTATSFLTKLEKITGTLPSRDAKPEAGISVTSTGYLSVNPNALTSILKLPPRNKIPGSPIAPKIRIRQYKIQKADGTLTPGYKAGSTFVEIKMPHPTADRGTLKPRIVVPDHIVDKLINPKFMASEKNRNLLVKTLSEGKTPKGAKETRLILDVFHQLAKKGKKAFQLNAKGQIRTEVNIKYARDAYQHDLKIDGKHIGVQFTFDRNVTYDNKSTLGNKHRVVEVKIPNAFANKSVVNSEIVARKKLLRVAQRAKNQGDIAKHKESIASLQTIKEIIGLQGFLSKHQLAGFPAWKGKFANRANFAKLKPLKNSLKVKQRIGFLPLKFQKKKDLRKARKLRHKTYTPRNTNKHKANKAIVRRGP